MGLETGTFIDDLVITNPPGSDDKRQGDDHIRLLKTVIRNTIKRASKAFFLPGSVSKSANYTVLDTDENLTIQCDSTAGTFNLSLPALDITRAGWMINVVKASTDMNPVFLVPPGAATINGFTKIRRSVAATVTQVIWTGGTWVASRPFGAPVGSVLEYYGSVLPQGHLWADGAAIVAANYVELAAILGANAPDRRGRVGVGRDNMGGTTAGRVTVGGSGITGTSLLAVGGGENTTLSSVAMLPSHLHGLANTFFGGNLGIGTEIDSAGNGQDHSHGWGVSGGSSGFVQGVNGRFSTYANSQAGYDLTHSHHQNGQTLGPGGGGSGWVGGGLSAGEKETDNGPSLDHVHFIDVGGTTGGRSNGHFHQIFGSTQPAGSATPTPFSNMPPSLVCNMIVVAE